MVLRMKRIPAFLFALVILAPATQADPAKTFVPMHDKGMATLYVHGTIEGIGTVEFLVDTGASYLALNEETISALLEKGSAHYVRKISAKMADGGKRSVSIYLISEIAIGDSCSIKSVEAAVIPGSARNILGLSALRKTAPFVFTMEPPALGLSHCAV